MNVNTIEIKNYRCFRNLEVTFHDQLTVLIAPNGGGKSTVLDALAYMLSVFVGKFDKAIPQKPDKGESDKPQRQEPNPEDVRVIRKEDMGRIPVHPSLIELSFCTDVLRGKQASCRVLAGEILAVEDGLFDAAKAMVRVLHSERPSAAVTLPIVAYYGSKRTISLDEFKVGPDLGNAALMRPDGYAGSLTASANANLFRTWYGKAAIGELSVQQKLSKNQPVAPSERKLAERARAVKEVVNLILGGASEQPRFWLDLFLSMNQVGVLDSEQNVELGLHQLSDGVQSMLSLAGDLAARCAVLNPHFGADAPANTPGVVLIDEVDLHLHPAWQQRVLVDLQRAFPLVQFIVTTHSPQVLTSVRRENIRLLTTDGQAITPDDGTYGAESSRVLEDVFGVHSRPPEYVFSSHPAQMGCKNPVADLRKYLALVESDKASTPEAVELRASLEDALGKHDPDLKLADIRASQIKVLGR